MNIRRAPNTSAGVITQLNSGHPVSVLERQGDWYRIRTSNGIEGWVFRKYLAVSGEPVEIELHAPVLKRSDLEKMNPLDNSR